MDKMPFISVLLYSVPESFLLFFFGVVIIGKKIKFFKLCTATIVSVILSYLVRILPLQFGFHYFMGFISIFLIFHFLLSLNLVESFLSTLISYSTLIALESVILYPIRIILQLKLVEIWKNPILRSFIGWPHLLVWSLITIYLYKRNITIYIINNRIR